MPVKLELRYAIEAKRAEKGLDMPVMDDVPRRPREVINFFSDYFEVINFFSDYLNKGIKFSKNHQIFQFAKLSSRKKLLGHDFYKILQFLWALKYNFFLYFNKYNF